MPIVYCLFQILLPLLLSRMKAEIPGLFTSVSQTPENRLGMYNRPSVNCLCMVSCYNMETVALPLSFASCYHVSRT